MERRTGQPFLATDDMADLHQMVVDDVRKVVCRQVVRALVEHFVVKYVRVDDHFATDEVVHMHVLVGLHLEAHHVFLALRDPRLYFLCGQRQRVAHLHAGTRIVLEIRYFRTFLLQLFWGIESDVGIP